MTQSSFDFAPLPDPEAIAMHQWVDKHNQQVMAAARTPTHAIGSWMSGIDAPDVQANSVYMLRCVIGQQMRKGLTPGPNAAKGRFFKALLAEISIKKSHHPVFAVRNTLINVQK